MFILKMICLGMMFVGLMCVTYSPYKAEGLATILFTGILFLDAKNLKD